jgi:hypothetical protein
MPNAERAVVPPCAAEGAAMIKELDDVVLRVDLPQAGLAAGDVGTVVLVHRGGDGFEVEFTALNGETVAVVTLRANEVRPVGRREISHVRDLVPA